MSQINKMITLLNYDYKYFYYFSIQVKSVQKKYVHKFNNKNQYQIYLVTQEKYNKRIKKKKYYENLYLNNKYQYYIIFTEKVISKYLRKQLYKDFLSITKSIIINILLEFLGIKKKLKNYLPI